MYEYDPLSALGTSLGADGLTVARTADGLQVTNEDVPGATDTITCRPRPEDGGRLWFWTGRGEPLAEADHLRDAILYVRVHLRRCADEGSGR
ncbi:hypothetical protein Acsp04_15690 [Actinomadura sp. NBRC 104425]|uniref:hypothetical protein n=1 Tax=Actinomadura sp. NBRC 104425 TaxID=3032204 RepID=UPI0024A55C8B|nr:hypothetical protein [Actinomadura sp. NBRC 104425]GLZ11334.1 hypothetical protein Acsp04_15690 [Actinomadura sp. NBRC 104425]